MGIGFVSYVIGLLFSLFFGIVSRQTRPIVDKGQEQDGKSANYVYLFSVIQGSIAGCCMTITYQSFEEMASENEKYTILTFLILCFLDLVIIDHLWYLVVKDGVLTEIS